MHFFHHYSVFFYADYGILYEELLVRPKKTQVVLHILYMNYVTFSNNMAVNSVKMYKNDNVLYENSNLKAKY